MIYSNIVKGTNKNRNKTVKKISVFGKYSLDHEHGTLNRWLGMSLPYSSKVASTNNNSEPKSLQIYAWVTKKVGFNNNNSNSCTSVVCCKECELHVFIPWFSFLHDLEDLTAVTGKILGD